MPSLAGRLDAYQRTVAGLEAARHAFRAQHAAISSPVERPGAETPSRGMAAATGRAALRLPRPAQIRRELARVTAAIRTYQQASRGAQNAIAIRGMGGIAVQSALLMLPPKVAIPVSVAVRAVSRGLDHGLDLGLGR